MTKDDQGLIVRIHDLIQRDKGLSTEQSEDVLKYIAKMLETIEQLKQVKK